MRTPGRQPLEHEGGLECEVAVGVLEVFNDNIIVGVSLYHHSFLNNKPSDCVLVSKTKEIRKLGQTYMNT